MNVFGTRTKKLALLLCLVPIIMAGCKHQQMDCCWSAETMQVDGQRTDWKGKPTSYFENLGVQVGFCNDADNLYILFSFTSMNKARIIGMSGLTIWLDNSGERKKELGIRFISKTNLSEIQHPQYSSGESMFLDNLSKEQIYSLLERRLLIADMITLIDIERNREAVVPADGSRGPRVRFHNRNRVYTYEFGIPLRGTGDNSYSLLAEPGQTISLGLEWGGNLDDLKRMLIEMFTDRYKHRSITGVSEYDFEQYQPKKQEVWLTTVLASQPPP